MTSPAVAMQTYLATNVSGWDVGTELFSAVEPAQPPDTITLFDTGGFAPDVTANYMRPTVQVRVRAVDYREGYARLLAVHDALADVLDYTLDDWRYFGAGGVGEPELLGRDDQGRFWIVQNFQIQRERV